MSTESERIPYLECGTAPGTRAILEAAAGTGKTYNITRLVARLLMERGDARIENMVVVTFTRAAAAELKTRISSLLSHLSKNLENGGSDELIDLAKSKGVAEKELKLRLHRALLNFDQAAIGTIHSFAMRVLGENSFGSRLKLNFSLNENTDPFIDEFCRDYFHTLLLKHSTPEERKLLTTACDLSVGKICAHVKERIHSPEIQVAVPGAPDYPDVETAISTALAIKKGVQPPRAGVIKAVCEEAFRSVSRKFRELSEAENFLSQDDLILRLRDALKENGDLLDALKKKYTIGLIDEFQDTSSAQFDIFRSLFLSNAQSTFIVVGDPRQAIYRFRHCDLATYFTAVKEMTGAEEYPMNTNRRSGARYIEALNAIFKPKGTFALAVKEMDMLDQQALPGSQVLWTSDRLEVEHPIQVCRKKEGLDSILKRCARDIACMLRAGYLIPPEEGEDGEIRPARALEAGDIAVLLNTRWAEGQRLRDALQKLNVPAVVLSEGNVFASPEAQELVRFLEGVLNPDDSAARLRALMTPLGDLDFLQAGEEKETAAQLEKLQALLEIWQKRSFGVMYAELCRKFRLYDRLNKPEGRIKLGKYNALADYLAEEAFARKLTPTALFDALRGHIESVREEKNAFPAPPETAGHAVTINTVFGSKGLSYRVVFLPDLFIETAVSKSGPARCHIGDREFLLPPMPGTAQFLKDLPEASAMYVREKDEEIQEDLRKAYVAFTRARYFCRFYCGVAQKADPIPGKEEDWPRNSAIDWLFRRNGAIPESFTGLSALMEGTFPPELRFPDAVGECDFPSSDKKNTPPVLPKLRRPDLLMIPGCHRGFLSFSALAGEHHGKNDAFASEKEDEGLLDTDEETKEIQNLRGSTAFGNAVHAVLQDADFSLSKEEFTRLAGSALDNFGLSDGKTKMLAGTIIWNALNSPLPDGLGGTFRLSAIDPARKKTEFEFLSEFDTGFCSSELFGEVRKYFAAKPGCREVVLPTGNEVFERGFFNGSIDLFFEHGSRFFIVDWKTNLLKGRDPYSQASLAAAMGQNGYCLQYLIYTAALFKYLKLRLAIAPENEKAFYEERFGGVYYLFVRGMRHDSSDNGIFRDKPPLAICKTMESFIG